MEDRQMVCRKCGSTKTELKDIRFERGGTVTNKRFKICKTCGHRVRKKHGDYREEKPVKTGGLGALFG